MILNFKKFNENVNRLPSDLDEILDKAKKLDKYLKENNFDASSEFWRKFQICYGHAKMYEWNKMRDIRKIEDLRKMVDIYPHSKQELFEDVMTDMIDDIIDSIGHQLELSKIEYDFKLYEHGDDSYYVPTYKVYITYGDKDQPVVKKFVEMVKSIDNYVPKLNDIGFGYIGHDMSNLNCEWFLFYEIRNDSLNESIRSRSYRDIQDLIESANSMYQYLVKKISPSSQFTQDFKDNLERLLYYQTQEVLGKFPNNPTVLERLDDSFITLTSMVSAGKHKKVEYFTDMIEDIIEEMPGTVQVKEILLDYGFDYKYEKYVPKYRVLIEYKEDINLTDIIDEIDQNLPRLEDIGIELTYKYQNYFFGYVFEFTEIPK